MKLLKWFCFGVLVMIIAVLVIATGAEKLLGTEAIAASVYGAEWFTALWTLLAVVGLMYLFRRRLRGSVLLLHLSLAVILVGACATRLCGRQGKVHLRSDTAVTAFSDTQGRTCAFPFTIELADFRVEQYPGTQVPMDFVGKLRFITSEGTESRTVSMNRIVGRSGYRFSLSGYDPDAEEVTLAVSDDPWGIGITYAGYMLLSISMVGCLAGCRSRFRRLLRDPALRKAVVGLIACAAAVQSSRAAVSRPPTLPRNVARELGALNVYYNDRICPLQTLARDFTVKLCGRNSYRGLSAEQVLAGWLFYYDEWKIEPMIRIKSAEVRRLAGTGGRSLRLADFRPILDARRQQGVAASRALREADEQFNLIGMLCTGTMLRLFPYTDPADSTLHWAAQTDVPATLPHDQWVFIRRAMDYANELVVKGDYAALGELFRKIEQYQCKACGNEMPSRARLRAERLYNRIGYTFPAAICFVMIGVAEFIVMVIMMLQGAVVCSRFQCLLDAMLRVSWVYLTILLLLRGYVCGRWPMSNGFETMQCMAWCGWTTTLLFHRRFALLLPMGWLVGGLALMVSVMGSSNPAITPLMPVLHSPLLSVHVVLVMAAYSLFALLALNSVAGLVCGRHPQSAARLQVVGQVMLYPAVFCLAAGIFVGAVWANISWGRYWGWDPKEVWALITLLIYALALHPDSLPAFRRPRFFHLFCIAAFLSVLITYFGVNLLLGGMHSYGG